MKTKRILLAVSFLIADLGSANAFDIMGLLVGAIKPGATRAICKSGGICRGGEGIGCSMSKNIASTCVMICQGKEGFDASTCVRKAQSKFGLDIQNKTYPGQTVKDHLASQIAKPNGMGNDPASKKLFDALCSKGRSLIGATFNEACDKRQGKFIEEPVQQPGGEEGMHEEMGHKNIQEAQGYDNVPPAPVTRGRIAQQQPNEVPQAAPGSLAAQLQAGKKNLNQQTPTRMRDPMVQARQDYISENSQQEEYEQYNTVPAAPVTRERIVQQQPNEVPQAAPGSLANQLQAGKRNLAKTQEVSRPNDDWARAEYMKERGIQPSLAMGAHRQGDVPPPPPAMRGGANNNIPPAPSLPAMVKGNIPTPPPAPMMHRSNVKAPPAPHAPAMPQHSGDDRNNLMAQIRQGKQLRKSDSSIPSANAPAKNDLNAQIKGGVNLRKTDPNIRKQPINSSNSMDSAFLQGLANVRKAHAPHEFSGGEETAVAPDPNWD